MQGKVALVTGASSGIGAAIARGFGQAGAFVVVNYARSQDAAEQVVAAIRAEGSQAIAVRADLSRREECENLVARATAAFGRLDVLVNNAASAGFVALEDLDGMDEATWDAVLSLNVKGAFFTARAAARCMQPGGAIINISSIAASGGRGTSIAYCASKAALNSITRSLALALAPGIRVMGLAPHSVDTQWQRDNSAAQGVAHEARLAARARQLPLQRLGDAEEVAGMAVFLARNARFATGQTWALDGGATIGWN